MLVITILRTEYMQHKATKILSLHKGARQQNPLLLSRKALFHQNRNDRHKHHHSSNMQNNNKRKSSNLISPSLPPPLPLPLPRFARQQIPMNNSFVFLAARKDIVPSNKITSLSPSKSV